MPTFSTGLPNHLLETPKRREYQPPPMPPGTRVKFHGVYLKAVGMVASSPDSDAFKTFTVVECSCELCSASHFVNVGEGRHIARASLFIAGTVSVMNDP